MVLKAGVLDDPKHPSENTPKAELFVPHRVAWIPAIDGAAQVDAMPPA